MSSLSDWGKVLVSLVVVVGFIGITVLYLTTKLQGGGTPEILSILLGALATNFTAVVGYWIGSSASSSSKDDLVRDVAMKGTGGG